MAVSITMPCAWPSAVLASDTAPIVSGCTSIAAARQPARLAIARTAGSAATTRIQECVTRSADR